MRTYEMTYITANEESSQAPTVHATLTDHKATITSVTPWDGGRRRFTYPIKKLDQGFYTTVVFDADPSAVLGIERDLRLNNDVIRALVVLFEASPAPRSQESGRPDRKEAAKPAVEAPVAETSLTEDVTEAKIAAEMGEPAEVVTEAKEETAEEKPKRKRAPRKTTEEDTKALDEKLDELLNEDLTS